MEVLKKIADFLGLHPLVGFGMFAVDLMLFGIEVSTLEVGWIISVPVAIALTVPCILIQKYNYGDGWGTAIGKGLMVGVLTAIPTALPAAVPFIGGALGMVKVLDAGGGVEEENTESDSGE